jgi:hypothetical protein
VEIKIRSISVADPDSGIISFGGTKNKAHFNNRSRLWRHLFRGTLYKIRHISMVDPGTSVISVGTENQEHFIKNFHSLDNS